MSTPTKNLAAILPSAGANLVLEDRPIPSPGPNELLIRNHAIALSPIDWKRQTLGLYVSSYPTILGTDIAGVVAKVGSAVTSFQEGDRVLASGDGIITGSLEHAGFQTYTVVSAASATKLPDNITFSQGASLPTAIATASVALFDVFGLEAPRNNTSTSSSNDDIEGENAGILVWGGASSTGQATIQLARLAGLKVFTTASERHHEFLRKLGATAVVDYRSTTVIDDLVSAANESGVDIRFAVDCVSTNDTTPSVVEVLRRLGGSGKKRLATLLPLSEEVARTVPEDVEAQFMTAVRIWNERLDLSAAVFNERLGGWLEKGEVVPPAVRVVEGGLGGLQTALDELKKGVSAEKLVVEL